MAKIIRLSSFSLPDTYVEQQESTTRTLSLKNNHQSFLRMASFKPKSLEAYMYMCHTCNVRAVYALALPFKGRLFGLGGQ